VPATRVYFYQEKPGEVPVLEWLNFLRRRNERGYAKCLAAIRLLAKFGHELRRPQADILRDGIRELRIKVGRVNYRILYFFHGQNVTVLSHGLTKEDAVPGAEIDRAVRRKAIFEKNPNAHAAEVNISDG
jgi:hypothetical protein